MAVDSEGNEIVEVVKSPDEIIADTVKVDDITHANTDLDKRLDELAGRKPNEAVVADTKKEVSKGAADVPDNKGTQKQGTQATTPAERPVGERSPQTFRPRTYPASYRSDVKGNVIDAATGTIIAQAGTQRVAFERMLPYIESIRSEGEKHRLALETATKANTIASSLNLAPDEYALGARIMAAYKSDPIKAIKYLLTEAQNNGIDTSDIAAGGGGPSLPALMAAIEEKLDAKLKPFSFITEERQRTEEEQQRHSAAEEGVTELLTEHPDAELHGLNIARVMSHHLENGKDISMREAYLIVRNYAHENGFDWTKDLTPQAQAKAAKLNGTTTTVAAPIAVIPPRTIPNMTGRESNGSIIPKAPSIAPGLADTGDIVREAMREAGIVIQ